MFVLLPVAARMSVVHVGTALCVGGAVPDVAPISIGCRAYGNGFHSHDVEGSEAKGAYGYEYELDTTSL